MSRESVGEKIPLIAPFLVSLIFGFVAVVSANLVEAPPDAVLIAFIVGTEASILVLFFTADRGGKDVPPVVVAYPVLLGVLTAVLSTLLLVFVLGVGDVYQVFTAAYILGFFLPGIYLYERGLGNV